MKGVLSGTWIRVYRLVQNMLCYTIHFFCMYIIDNVLGIIFLTLSMT